MTDPLRKAAEGLLALIRSDERQFRVQADGFHDAVTALRSALQPTDAGGEETQHSAKTTVEGMRKLHEIAVDTGKPNEALRQLMAGEIVHTEPDPLATAINRLADRSSQRPSPSVGREEVARIIDPSSWRVFDGYLADVKRKYKGQDAAYDPEAFKDKASLAKADAILALAHPATVAVEGEWVTVPREPTREMWAAMGDAVVGYKQRHHDKVSENVWTAALAAAPKPTLPAGEWTDEQVEAAARAIEALGLYVANGFVSGLMARDAACAALATITPTAGGQE